MHAIHTTTLVFQACTIKVLLAILNILGQLWPSLKMHLTQRPELHSFTFYVNCNFFMSISGLKGHTWLMLVPHSYRDDDISWPALSVLEDSDLAPKGASSRFRLYGVPQPSECGRQHTLISVHAQTAALQQSNVNSEARMSEKCREWRD